MTIFLAKFDKVLNGRLLAREAALRMQLMLRDIAPTEPIILDFQGVEVLTPSYAGELLDVLRRQYGTERITLANAAPAVRETLQAIDALAVNG